MLHQFKIPKTIIWVINLFVIFWGIFTFFRIITFIAFRPKDISVGDVAPSFLLGIRYDWRWISFMLLPLVLFSLIPKLSPFFSVKNKKWWTWYLAILTFIIFFFYAAWFGSFSYNRTPLDAGAMNFVEDPRISLKMMFQTYPMVWMILGLVAAVLFFRWMYHRSHWQVTTKTDGMGILYRRKYFLVTAVVLLLMAWGSFSANPLKWNGSFRFGNSFKSYLSLNPFQHFFTTLKMRKPDYDEAKAKQAFPLMADWMQLNNKNNFSYRREVGPRSTSFESRPNIVLVQCESFSMYKSTMSGNPTNATPYFDSLCRNGIFFEKCFAPHFSTARALFAIISGTPDAQVFKFSSRNPRAVEQHTIINNFIDYDKYYFLGGDAEFGNFEGLISNIDDLKMHTGIRDGVAEVNVWGISDKRLFLEANDVFRKSEKPFFAYIQTAGNHRPYNKTIDASDTDFVRKVTNEEELKKYGFESVDEYNCFRYSDYCFQKFIQAAATEKYFSNTIFVFVGDHGLAGNADAMYPPVWTSQRLTDEHVPLLFYAPSLFAPQKRGEVVSQIDILPTIAGMVHQPYVNTTLGRDLLDPNKKNNYAFITNTSDMVGMVTDNFFYTKNIYSNEEQLFPMNTFADIYSKQQQDSAKKTLSVFTAAFYETAKYLLMNNKGD